MIKVAKTDIYKFWIFLPEYLEHFMNIYSWFSIMCSMKRILLIFYLKSDTCDYTHILSQNAVSMSWGQAHFLRPFSDKKVQYFQNSKNPKILKLFQNLKKKSKILIFLKFWTFWHFFLNIENF